MTHPLTILYEDKYILAVHKPAGVATQTSRVAKSDIVSMTRAYLAETRGGYSRGTHAQPYVGLINRLDQPVEGIVLMALDERTAAALSKMLRDGRITKRYLAGVVMDAGDMCPISDGAVADNATAPHVMATFTDTDSYTTLTDYIARGSDNMSHIVPASAPNAKEAILKYKFIRTLAISQSRIALADIELVTGRHHQIRVQMAHAGMPLIGDRRYASEYVQNVTKMLKVSEICLCAHELTFTHPFTDDKIDLRVVPQGKWFDIFN